MLPGASRTGCPSAPVSTTGSSGEVLDQVAASVRPPVATSASPEPTIWVSGTGLPAASVNRVLTTSTRSTTTLAARSRVPSASTDGVVRSARSQRPSGGLHVHVGELRPDSFSRTAAVGRPVTTALGCWSGAAMTNCAAGAARCAASAWARNAAGRRRRCAARSRLFSR